MEVFIDTKTLESLVLIERVQEQHFPAEIKELILITYMEKIRGMVGHLR